jgi:hypothetical protein
VSGRGLASLCLCAACAFSPASARGQILSQPDAARHRLRYASLLAVQYNPLGLQGELQVGYRYRLFDRPSLLLGDSYAGAFASTRINPAFTRIGAGLELQPVAVLALRAIYEHRLYYGAFGMLQSFESPAAVYDEETLKARADGGANYPGHGHELTLQAVLRAKLGPIAFLDDLSLIYFKMNLRTGDRVFYDNLLDALIPGDGFVLVNNGHLLYLHGSLVVGVRYTLVHALYPRDWLPGGDNPNTPNHRIGPMAAYVFRDWSPRARQPTLILIVNWWINNRYRSPSANPYGVLAFQLSGDLWSR